MHLIDLPDWARDRGRRSRNFGQVNRAQTALVVVDLQKAFTAPHLPMAARMTDEIIPACNPLIDAAREAGIRIVFLRHTYSDAPDKALPSWQILSPRRARLYEDLRPESAGHDLSERLHYQAGDMVVDKYRMSAFVEGSSKLDAQLRAEAIDTLIICGAITNGCCEATARDAMMMGYRILFAEEATGTRTDEEHNASLLNLALLVADVRPNADLISIMQAAG